MGIDPVDAGVIGLVLISGLFAFFRGFIREVLAIAGWVGAALATLWAFPIVSPLMRQWISHPMVADGVAIVAVFVGVLIVVSLISHTLATRVHASSLGALDRSLGFLFGLARGAVIVCVAYLTVAMLASNDEDPAWLKGARTLPLVRGGAEMLYALVPDSMRAQGRATAKDLEAKGTSAVEGAKAIEELKSMLPTPAAPSGEKHPGYTDSERQRLLQLYKNSQGQ
jgi:membrane protein required for colicin V production